MLYDAGQFVLTSPDALQCTIWWHMTVLFGHGGGGESRQLKWGDAQLKTDSPGANYLEFNERVTKTRDGEPSREAGLSTPKPFIFLENPKMSYSVAPPSRYAA